VAIDYGALRSLTAQQLIGALVRDGFVFDRGAGAHQIYYRPADRRRVTVSFHRSGQTFPPKTLKKMIEVEARWSEDDLRRLKLIK
jgi:predicted RNA binding protein YcfA (HicA-like mRNA interferase family)